MQPTRLAAQMTLVVGTSLFPSTGLASDSQHGHAVLDVVAVRSLRKVGTCETLTVELVPSLRE